jgi:hypothetical protein
MYGSQVSCLLFEFLRQFVRDFLMKKYAVIGVYIDHKILV